MFAGSYRGFDAHVEDPGIGVITFNQPERLNGFTHHAKRDLVEVLTQAQMDHGIRVVVITGSGRAFSAGDDITGRPVSSDGEAAVPDIPRGHDNPIGTYEGLRVLSQTLNEAVRKLDKLTIAAVNGVAIQTGLSLALSCDFRVASTEARLGSGTLRFGLLPDEGAQYLVVQHIGVAKAMDFFMRNRILPASEAHELGLVHEVVEPDQLMPRTMELAKELAEGPQVAMRLLKTTIYNAADMTWPQALDDIAGKTAISDHHPDAREGVAAFREKRKPGFNAWLEEHRQG
ncbi:MAG: enoyl-CoA hydratase/isomerase family protein [Dehalococcoidia bacterium]|nr:enoyl-CoA hydratase/isomerase family protein [Dehalococcoidia bacterium]